MIVPMKKITLICMAKDRNSALHDLREMGVVHLVPLKEPAGNDLAAARSRLQNVRQALDILRPYSRAGAGVSAGLPVKTAEAVVDETHELAAKKKELSDAIDADRAEESRLAPWGDFDPEAVKRLAAAGVTVKLYHSASKDPVVPPEGAQLHVARHDKNGIYFALIGQGDIKFEGREVLLPAVSLSELRGRLAARSGELAGVEAGLGELAASAAPVAELAARLDETRRYVEVRRGMESAGPLVYLRGFCPADRVESLCASAVKEGWGIVVDDPAPEDTVPTLIRSPAWVRPIDSAMKFLKILPGYREADVSPVFLVFLSLFFAMIVGDGGYGAIFLALTLYARRRMKKAPAEPFILMGLFSVCTIIWGALSGVWFGMKPCPAPLERFHFNWLDSNDNIMDLCLVIGATQLTIAHLWAAVRVFPSTRAIAQVGWAGMVWIILFVARCLFRSQPFPHWIGVVAAVCIGLILVFMTPLSAMKKEVVNNFMLPLSLMSAFGDVLSYLRLFALGIASVQLASSFNTMAMKIGFNSVLGGLGTALIIFVGHALNCVLSAMSVLVHGIRLNALEFSMHLGMEWSGTPYLPFARRRAGTES